MKKGFVFLSLCIGLIFFMGNVSQLFAQESKGDEFTLEEITVTAAKRGEQNLQKVPLAMDVISDQDLATEGKANVDDILSELASVFINTSADGMRISIRGITDTDPVYGGRKSSSPTVAMNVDGTYSAMNNSGQNLFDVERIEVLMGPQSTLYAANSPGGVVNIITAAPKTDKYSANISALYGSYEHSDIQAALNAPIVNEKLAMRLSLNRTRENNFLEPYTDLLSNKNDAARLKLLWKAADNLEITLTGNYSKNGNQGEMSQQAAPFNKSSSSAWTAAANAQGANNPIDQITKGWNANISWNSPIGNLTITPSSSRSDSSGSQAGNVNYPPGPPGPNTTSIAASWYSSRVMTQKGAEARLASSEDFKLLQYVVGFSYYKSQFDTITAYNNTADYPNLSAQLNNSNVNNTKQKALYGNITYPMPFNDKLSVTAGYRRSWDYAHQLGFDAGRVNAQNPTGKDETQMDLANPDYKLGFQYDMTDKVMIYGSYTSSFRTDSMAMTNNDGVRPPEKLKAYTVGAKTRMFDNSVQLNTSVYYYDYKNKLAQNTAARGSYTEDELKAHTFASGTTTIRNGQKVDIGGLTYWDWLSPSPQQMNPDGTFNLDDGGWMNWGKLRTIGLDASVSWVASAKDMVDFSLSYLDMKWTQLRFNYIYDAVGFWPDQNFDGRRAPSAPKLSMTASYEHNFDIGSYGVLTPHIDVQHKSAFDLTFDQSDGLGYGKQEAYFLWNGSAAFNSNSGKWSVGVNVKNITNYAVKKSYEADNKILRLGDPRTYEATLSLKF
jgi:iron complex outermembrane recepter protein